jgi:hypothetical protein
MRPRARIAVALALVAAWAAPAPAQDATPQAQGGGSSPTDPPLVVNDPTYLETPPFPGSPWDAVRVHFQSLFIPGAELGPGETTLYRPELRARVTAPITDRLVTRVSVLGGMGRYQFDGPDAFQYGGSSLTGDSLDLYQTRLSGEAAWRVNETGSFWLREGEVWSLLGGVVGASDFESGAFDDGLTGGARFAVGYELPERLRFAAGVSVDTSLAEGGVGVSPTGSFEWSVSDRLTLRNHGLGLQVEYRVTPSVELFAKGFRTTQQYHLDGVNSVPGDLTFEDRQILAGGGLEWRVFRSLRVNAEAGAVSWRRVRVREDDLGTLVAHRADPSAYFELRLEVRPRAFRQVAPVAAGAP